MQAAFAYLDSARDFGRVSKKFVLISPAAQEYLQPAQPARDPDLMPPVPAATLTFPSWKLLLQSSHEISGVTAQKLSRSAERDLRKALKKFTRELLGRHKNAMIIRCNLSHDKREQLLASAAVIASDYNFINPVIAESPHVTLAFVPLSVDPPAAINYARVITQLSSEFGAALEVVACPREVIPYLPAPIQGKISFVIRVIKKLFWRHGA